MLEVNGISYPTFCVVTNSVEAWALIFKIDGNRNTFLYHSSLWTNQATFNDAAVFGGLDNQEYKSPLYWQYPFIAVRVGMTGSRASMAFNQFGYVGTTLLHQIADGGKLAHLLK